MNQNLVILAVSLVLGCEACAGTRHLTFIYQPLTTFGTEQDAAVVIARVPVLTNAVPESIIAHIASPNKLPQDTTDTIADSNILSLLGISLSAKPVTQGIYDVTIDIREMRPSDRFGLTAGDVIAATIECLKKTFNEQRWDTFVLSIQTKGADKTDWRPYEGRIDAK